MRKSASFLSRRALLCAALVLGPGCKSVEPSTRPTDGTTPGQDTGPVSAPDASTPGTTTPETVMPEQTASPWQRARVGDRVTYSFSANRSQPGTRRGMNIPSAAVAGVVSVEVVAVQAPWVWLGVTFSGEGGAAPQQPRLARSLVVPVRSDVTRTLEAPREGTETTEQPTAADRSWEAKRYINDRRPADGPLENRLYAVNPGPLYLTNGLLDASTTLSGFGMAGGTQLTLMEARLGNAGGAGQPPALTLPMGPGAWYDVAVDSGGAASTQRTCLGAERGFVLRQQATATGEGGTQCQDLSQAEAQPLEEALLGLIDETVNAPQWPPQVVGAAPVTRATLDLKGPRVTVLQLETKEDVGGVPGGRVQAFAADPWDAALAGLPLEARFQTLSDTTYRAAKGSKREPVDSTKLVGWGTWVPGTKP
ncbi:DUF6068 family protein [Pyxidicoccus trucidator]|uniref:DUF6068 family protein n=1 Tax=Pyxidicoccus trucidator TaxID=2709662 RepID=UPI0013D8FAC7|nr:DUF6068 family protein [Pyxidicoccus trucidator]